MTWLKRHGASMALAAILAVIGGAAVGCSTDDGNDGTGGSGGTAGAGGDGGTGGTGGDELCGSKTCDIGEKCNRGKNPPRCECTSSPDSCTEADPALFCTATKVCKKLNPDEWDECDSPGEFTPNGDLWCAPGFGEDGETSYWLRVCTDSSSCSDGLSFCDKVTWGSDGEHGLCYYNHCGDERKRQDGTLKNGGNWSSCDSEVGFPDDASAGSGQCVPVDGPTSEVFLCLPAGQTPVDGPCRFDTDARADEACAAMTICLTKNLPANACETADDCDPLQVCTDNKCADKACATDDDCGGTGYCFDDGQEKICMPFGTCSELCNAGMGDAPTCTSTDDVCIGALTNRPDFENARGYCSDPGCDMLDPNSCEDEDGQARMCIMASPVKGHPFMGLCINQPDTVLEKGTACEGADVCEQGTLCIGSQATGKYFCRGLCECPEADWDTSGLCKTAADQCATTETCAYFGGAPTLGACIPK